MKICVLGAGAIGVTTAYILARAGHKVTLIDKAPSEAQGTSQANGAQLSYSYVDPFASPETLRRLPKYFFGQEAGVKFGWSLSPAYISWGFNFLKNCSARAYEKNLKSRMDLSNQSRSVFMEIESQVSNNLLQATSVGKIVVTSKQKELDSLLNSAKNRIANGSQLTTLSANECIQKVPELSRRQSAVLGGVFCETDHALDSQSYCAALLSETGNADLTTMFNTEVTDLIIKSGKVVAVVTETGKIECDQVVACLGGQSNSTLSSFTGKLPIYPVQGYSLTLPATQHTPKCSVTDLDHKLVIANLGDKVRIAGFMDVNMNAVRSKMRAKELLDTARSEWPEIADYTADPNFWVGQRPMTPSGMPYIGKTKTNGLFINAGHGSLGYTFATGSAAKILDIIGPATSEVI